MVDYFAFLHFYLEELMFASDFLYCDMFLLFVTISEYK